LTGILASTRRNRLTAVEDIAEAGTMLFEILSAEQKAIANGRLAALVTPLLTGGPTLERAMPARGQGRPDAARSLPNSPARATPNSRKTVNPGSCVFHRVSLPCSTRSDAQCDGEPPLTAHGIAGFTARTFASLQLFSCSNGVPAGRVISSPNPHTSKVVAAQTPGNGAPI